MKVKLYGTRGSTPTARADQARYGGNTTCVRIISDCVPPGTGLIVDAGSGFTQLSQDLIRSHPRLAVLFTHYHHDHTQGICLAPHAYAPHASLRLYGPYEHRIGPAEVMGMLFQPPLFPVEFAKIRHQVECKNFEHIGTQILVVHPEAGLNLISVDAYRRAVQNSKQLPLGTRRESLKECLVITMHKTVHPEYTVSYRFNEMPTGKSFVFLTDHENTDGYPQELMRHVSKTDLLIQDGQYSREVYETRTAGFGHGTPDYCAELAVRGKVGRLGITHHDPTANDEEVDLRINEAKAHAAKFGQQDSEHPLQEIFGCADGLEIEV